MTKKEYNVGLELPDIEQLYIHWVNNGCPNREKIREIRDSLPVSLSLYEGLLPYFNSLKDEPLVKKENEASKEERSIVVTSDVKERSSLVQDDDARTIVVTSD